MWPKVSVFLIKSNFCLYMKKLIQVRAFERDIPFQNVVRQDNPPPHLRRNFLEPRMVCFHKYDKANNKEAAEMVQACLRKPDFDGLRTTKTQTSLRIRAVWSAPLIFAYWKEFYLDLLRRDFNFLDCLCR